MAVKISQMTLTSSSKLTDLSEIVDSTILNPLDRTRSVSESQKITLYANTFLSKLNNLSDLSSASSARVSLGLGSIATQNSSLISVTGGTIDGTSIGATSASTIRANSLNITAFGAIGVVHNDASGNFTSSLIVGADISNNAVSNAKLSLMPANTLKGNNTGISANALDLTTTEVISLLSLNITAGQIAYGNGANGLTSSSAFNFDGTNLNLTGSTAIKLPTSGATASQLNYYEESTSIVFSMSGPWTARNWTVTFTRIGNIVNISWPDLSASVTASGNKITSSTPLPIKFRPASAKSWAVKVIDGASSITINNGDFIILTGGVLNIAANNNNNFVLANAGIVSGSVSYIV